MPECANILCRSRGSRSNVDEVFEKRFLPVRVRLDALGDRLARLTPRPADELARLPGRPS